MSARGWREREGPVRSCWSRPRVFGGAVVGAHRPQFTAASCCARGPWFGGLVGGGRAVTGAGVPGRGARAPRTLASSWKWRSSRCERVPAGVACSPGVPSETGRGLLLVSVTRTC